MVMCDEGLDYDDAKNQINDLSDESIAELS